MITLVILLNFMSAILFAPLYYHYMLYLKNSENYDNIHSKGKIQMKENMRLY